MARKTARTRGASRGILAALFAVGFFGALAVTPFNRLAPPVAVPRPPTSFASVRLVPAPTTALQPVAALPVARVLAPGSTPVRPLPVNPNREAALIRAEDFRLRTLLHLSIRTLVPTVVLVPGGPPTLILPGSLYYQTTYTLQDLITYGALRMASHHVGLLVDSVFVGRNAQLTISSGQNVRSLYLNSTGRFFTSIVSWGGSLVFRGTAARPLSILGWNHNLKRPATDRGAGRSYIRAIASRMVLTEVRASGLGFWSGRTGGVSWTGTAAQDSTGGATRSTFINDTYGAFAARTDGISFANDLFEHNQLDGLHIHRYSVVASVTGSFADLNGANGFVVDRATSGTVLRGDVAQNNGGNGFRVDGRPLVGGASASGVAVTPGSGTVIEESVALSNVKTGIVVQGGIGTLLRSDVAQTNGGNGFRIDGRPLIVGPAASGSGGLPGTGTKLEYSFALNNLRTGILIEGGIGTLLLSDDVCARITSLAIRYSATRTIVTGNRLPCGGRTGIAIGPYATNTIVSGNSVLGARIGILVRSAAGLQIDNSVITRAKVFGIMVRGASQQVKGLNNVITGIGFRPVDARVAAGQAVFLGTHSSGWIHHLRITPVSYLKFHPLAASWLGILMLILLGALGTRFRRMPDHPYAASTRWGPQHARDPYPVDATPVPASPSDNRSATRSRVSLGEFQLGSQLWPGRGEDGSLETVMSVMSRHGIGEPGRPTLEPADAPIDDGEPKRHA